MSPLFLESPLLPLLFLLGSLLLTTCSSAILHLGKFKSKELFRSKNAPKFFFRSLLKKFFRYQEWDNLYFCLSLTKHILELGYAIFAFCYLISKEPFLLERIPSSEVWGPLLLVGGSIIALSIVLDFIMRLFAHLWSQALLKFTCFFASFYLLLFFPFVGLLLKVTRGLLYKTKVDEESGLVTDKAKLKEMLKESELQHYLEASEEKLIGSFLSFKDRVAKEIMVPRVDVFSIPVDTPIEEAAKIFVEEGYSRIPVYKDSLDEIVGVVLYKDLFQKFIDPKESRKVSLEKLVKPVLYAPEKKKISHLLQEFRNKQIHMAIIVDEYGGTEGIVTIEDALEELVGEIEDEYDTDEEEEFWEIPGGNWIVDAKMTLIDIESQLGVKIPESPEYETIGGYIFHNAGTIPQKGWKISHDAFDLEVLSSNERSIKKIKITPRKPPEKSEGK